MLYHFIHSTLPHTVILLKAVKCIITLLLTQFCPKKKTKLKQNKVSIHCEIFSHLLLVSFPYHIKINKQTTKKKTRES